jgi:broad specificity phosphatase PhoE
MHVRPRFLNTLALSVAMMAPAAHAFEPTVIFLTRHGEKINDSADPALSPAGQLRAQNLAAILKKAQVRQIFSTAYVRTRATVAPLSELLTLPVQTYSARDQAKFAQQLKSLSGTTLVAGHSNTIPELVRLLGGAPGAEMPETEFDRLYQLIIEPDGKVTTVMLTSLPAH